MQGLMLLAEAKLDRFVKEFNGLVREAVSGCQLSDFQATPAEIGGWFGKAVRSASEKEHAAKAESTHDNRGTQSCSKTCTEVVKNG
jgi:hypothetical protein